MLETPLEAAKKQLLSLSQPNIQHVHITYHETDKELIISFNILDGIFAGQELKTYYDKEED